MGQYLILAYFCFLSNFTFAQSSSKLIEINPFMRFDNYPAFSYTVHGRASTDNLKMSGINVGINFNYKLPVKKNIYFKVGLGYFKYSFDKLDNTNSLFGNSKARVIDFPSILFILYSTNKYYYNTVSVNLGVEKSVTLKKNLQLITGFTVANYFTFSQHYHLSFNPEGTQDYKKNNNSYFGFSCNLSAAIVKHIGKIQIGPSIIVPVFDLWEKDNTLPESSFSGSRTKLFNGLGFGIVCNIPLSTQKK
jgi:hypothetical protein